MAIVDPSQAGEAAAPDFFATLFDGWKHVLGLWLRCREAMGNPRQLQHHHVRRRFSPSQNVIQVLP